MESGIVYEGALDPGKSMFFSGKSKVGSRVDEESLGLLFDARIRVGEHEPDGASLFAGSVQSFSPLVREDYAAIAARDINPGYMAEIVGPYSPSGPLSRQMIIGVTASYHEKSSVPLPAPFARVGNSNFMSSARELRGLQSTGEASLQQSSGNSSTDSGSSSSMELSDEQVAHIVRPTDAVEIDAICRQKIRTVRNHDLTQFGIRSNQNNDDLSCSRIAAYSRFHDMGLDRDGPNDPTIALARASMTQEDTSTMPAMQTQGQRRIASKQSGGNEQPVLSNEEDLGHASSARRNGISRTRELRPQSSPSTTGMQTQGGVKWLGGDLVFSIPGTPGVESAEAAETCAHEDLGARASHQCAAYMTAAATRAIATGDREQANLHRARRLAMDEAVSVGIL